MQKTELWTPSVPVPSPREIDDSATAKGGFTAKTLAQWGVPWPPPAGWQATLLKAWITEHGAVDYGSNCGVEKVHAWSSQTPKTAKAAKYWVCAKCRAISVTMNKRTRYRIR